MHNFFRFTIGLVITILVIALTAIVALILSPIVIVGTVLFIALLVIGIIIFVVLTALAFVWFISRKEKPINKHKEYKISQGREIKHKKH